MLKIENLSVSYGEKSILKEVNLSLQPRKITVLIGRNGSGKSTLVSAINGSVKYTGDIYLSGKNLKDMEQREKAKIISFLPQVLPNPSVTVRELVSFGRSPYLGFGSKLSGEDIDIINSAIKNTDMESFANKPVNKISGGERQRAFLSMVLAQNTDIVVLDEPTTYMDFKYKEEFLQLLSELKTVHHKTVLVILHDITDAYNYGDNFAVIDGGKIVFDGNKEESLKTIKNVFGLQPYYSGEKIFFSI